MYIKKERKYNVMADQNERWTIRNSTGIALVIFLDQAWQSHSLIVDSLVTVLSCGDPKY